MANTNTIVTATGSYVITIDNDGDSASQSFRLNAFTGPTTLFEVYESGNIDIVGYIKRNGAVRFDNSDTVATADPIVSFVLSGGGGGTMGSVHKDGSYDVEGGAGVYLPNVTSDPSGSLSKTRGEAVVWEKSLGGGLFDYYICVNTSSSGSTTNWKKFVCT